MEVIEDIHGLIGVQERTQAHDLVKETLMQAKKLTKGKEEVLLQLGKCLNKLEEPEEALDVLNKIESSPTGPDHEDFMQELESEIKFSRTTIQSHH